MDCVEVATLIHTVPEDTMNTKGALVAAAVAGLFSTAMPMVASAKSGAKVHCEGVNSCKGKGACKSATNACTGKNECKGKGWISMTQKECKADGGTVATAMMK